MPINPVQPGSCAKKGAIQKGSVPMQRSYILTVCCRDRSGLTADVTDFIARHGGWITEASQHSDAVENAFFMRIEVLADSLSLDIDDYREAFAQLAQGQNWQWRISDTAQLPRTLICVSKFDHCLNELLYRWRSQDFGFDIPAVVSNHEELRDFVEWHGIPFHHIPVNPQNKQQAFEELFELFWEYQSDALVLARYMQILPPWLCQRLEGKIINIHHSFLPSFVGAKPYHQAFDRGVKLIGATCHYVTEDLDAGPIIEQDVVRINHSHSIDDMVRLGRDVEKQTLARGLRNHCQDRVLLHNRKTIVFE